MNEVIKNIKSRRSCRAYKDEQIGTDILNEIIDSKDKTVLVYCRSGNRSEKAAVKLVDNGFKM